MTGAMAGVLAGSISTPAINTGDWIFLLVGIIIGFIIAAKVR